MQITYEGHDYQFDQQAITVDEWRELKRKYKMTPKAFGDGIDEGDPDAMTFLYWILLRQNGGTPLPLGDHLKPGIIALNNATFEAYKAAQQAEIDAAQAEAEPDPTSLSPSPSPAASPSSPAPPNPAPNPSSQTEVTAPTTGS